MDTGEERKILAASESPAGYWKISRIKNGAARN
jgi:hypothetical protein